MPTTTETATSSVHDRITTAAQLLPPDYMIIRKPQADIERQRYLAISIANETIGSPSHTKDDAIESLYDQMDLDGDALNDTIVILIANGPLAALLHLQALRFEAGYCRLTNYSPDPRERRRDRQAADVDELAMRHLPA